MGYMPRKNIKVPEDLFLALRDNKDDQQSWPHYLEEQCLHDSTHVSHLDSIAEGMSQIEGRIDDLEARLPRKVAEELEGQR
jgi:hypothetical protein